jgi:hypothetical protein
LSYTPLLYSDEEFRQINLAKSPSFLTDSGGGIRTHDLQVMSLASCLCSTPHQ